MNSADEKEVARTKRDKEEVQRQRDEDMRKVMASADGRRFFWRVLESTGVFGASFTGDALSSAYNEGRRAVGLALMEEAKRTCASDYVHMLGEQFAHVDGRRQQGLAGQ